MPDAQSSNDFVTRALRLLNVVGALDSPEPEELISGRQTLNEMIDLWAIQRRLIFYEAANQYGLTSGQDDYTIGVGGNFNQVRPTFLSRWSLIPDDTVTPIQTIDMGRPLEIAEWQAIPVKSITGPYPQKIYFDHAFALALAKIWVWPVPDNSNCGIILWTPTPLTEFADLTTQYNFPPGYAHAIRTNLAVVLALEHPGMLTPEVRQEAIDAKAWVKRGNFRAKEAQFDAALVGSRGGRYNIYTD